MTHQKDLPSQSSKATKLKPDASSKEEIFQDIQLVGKSELKSLGLGSDDELVVSLGQTKPPGVSRQPSTES